MAYSEGVELGLIGVYANHIISREFVDPFYFYEVLEKLIDFIFSVLPQKTPSFLQARNAKLVAHRGARKYGIKENTLKGFESCIDHQVWGIEFDIRWTKDYEPILLHDINANHIFHRPDIIPNQLTILELKKEIPEIPTLEEVVQKFGQKIHFMIELKECFSSHSIQTERLMQVLSPLQAINNYHLLSLNPEELLSLSKIPKEALIGISTFNTKEISKIVMNNSLGGHCGHYLLLSKQMQKLHEASQQKVGTGYVSSRNSLYREIQRGVEWIFTNNPFEIQNELNKVI
jgi:glycerophosphoryl diester phosphodiesterase